MRVLAVIPARYASTRFPGKPLALLGGKPMIEWVWERVASLTTLSKAVIATDDGRIAKAVTAFDGKAMLTSGSHRSGTDRCGEVLKRLEAIGEEYDVVLNVQGDEPFVTHEQLTTLLACFDDPSTQIATLGKPFDSMEGVCNPNSPKIVLDNKGFALYFSRSVIPFIRGVEQQKWLENYPFLKHLGVYAYRAEVLREVTRLPQSSLEKAESLEQLRWLQNGYRIRVGITQQETVGIDTPEDLARAEEFLKSQGDGAHVGNYFM